MDEYMCSLKLTIFSSDSRKSCKFEPKIKPLPFNPYTAVGQKITLHPAGKDIHMPLDFDVISVSWDEIMGIYNVNLVHTIGIGIYKFDDVTSAIIRGGKYNKA